MIYQNNKYIDLVKDIVLKNIPKELYTVFLFGSRVSGANRFASDIDIGISGNKPLDKKVMYKIKDEIEESIVPFKVDVIDFFETSEKFKSKALKDIELWNKPKATN